VIGIDERAIPIKEHAFNVAFVIRGHESTG
jgi:hypothetical protein